MERLITNYYLSFFCQLIGYLLYQIVSALFRTCNKQLYLIFIHPYFRSSDIILFTILLLHTDPSKNLWSSLGKHILAAPPPYATNLPDSTLQYTTMCGSG